MPSRAEIRGGVENALRALSIVILAWMLWLSVNRSRPESVVSVRSEGLTSSLRGLSLSGSAPDRIAARLDSTPSPLDRDWLRALGGAGSEVTWNGDLPVTAIDIRPVVSPRGGLTVIAAAPSGTSVRIADDIGALDTAVAGNNGARFSIPSASGFVRARIGNSTADAVVPDSVQIRRVLVIGSAGWESKFVTAALEESGWKVDAEMSVAPGVSVTQGISSPIDTSRYAAIVALDGSAAGRASEMVRFVESGGGLVLAGTSTALEAFSKVRPGAPGRADDGSALSSEPGTVTLGSLAVIPIASIRADAVPVERRGASVIAAARRSGAGRVLQSGYIDTWRWRMSGGDNAPEDHRAWWTRAVAAVAYAPVTEAKSKPETDNAPMARLIASLGPESATSPASLASAAGSVSLWLLFGLLAVSLLGEWASRRLRGAR